MSEVQVPDIELVKLTELEPTRLICDIGNHTNLGAPPCPDEAKWRLAYSCCGKATLLCPWHKDRFLDLCKPLLDEGTYCPHCRKFSFLRDILIVEPL